MGMRWTVIMHEAGTDTRQFLLQEKGYIYTKKHEGWYSVTDEAFYPESAIRRYLDPPTGRKVMVCIESSINLRVLTATDSNRDWKRGGMVVRNELPLSPIRFP